MPELSHYIATLIVGVGIGLILRSLEPKVKIVWWTPHAFFFDLPERDMLLVTHTFTIQNIGRKTATGIEIIHPRKPDIFKLSPVLDYEEEDTPDQAHVVRIKSLGPKEVFSIEFLSFETNPGPPTIRSEDGIAEFILTQSQRIIPRKMQWAVAILMLAGSGYLLYWTIKILAFLLRGVGIIN